MLNNLIPKINKSKSVLYTKLIVLNLVLSYSISDVDSQNSTPYEDHIKSLIQSPNVASLNKFIEFPVSNFNGTVDVSFPLYEIKLNSISLPITLRYNTSGIRVNEESSWVGLGWTLDFGGQITRQIFGKDDLEGQFNKFGKYFPHLNPIDNTYNEAIIGSALTGKYLPDATGELKEITDDLIYSLPYDSEPDLYLYKIGNYSGKFIHGYDENVVDLSLNGIKFQHFYTPGTISGDYVIATTPDGCVYKFMVVEKGFTLTGIIPIYEVIDDFIVPRTNTYLLSEIITKEGEYIKFYYKSFKEICSEKGWESSYPLIASSTHGYYINSTSLIEEHQQIEVTGGELVPCMEILHDGWKDSKLRSYTFIQQMYLDKIVFPTGSIKFIAGKRDDIYGVKLDTIKIMDLNDKVVKNYSFNYGYFISDPPDYGTDVITANNSPSFAFYYPNDYLSKRLKLLSYSINNDSKQKYLFNYNETKLPWKTSFSQDFWGYFNGKQNYTLLPSYSYSSIGAPSSFKRNVGANRDVDTSKVKAGTLSEVIYPTGGKTIFEYESNQVINFNIGSFADNSISSKVYSALDLGAGTNWTKTPKENIFTINENRIGDISYCLYNDNRITSGDVEDLPNAFFVKVEKYSDYYNSYMLYNNYYWDADHGDTFGGLEQITFTPGTYKLSANYPSGKSGCVGSNMAFISAYIYYENYMPSYNNFVGGLRIKKIIHKDEQPVTSVTRQSPAIVTNYSYQKGMLATYPSFVYDYEYEYFPSVPESCDIPKDLVFSAIWCAFAPAEPHIFLQYVKKIFYSASALQPLSYSANGSNVGYQVVTETKSDGEIGRAEYEYKMEMDKGMMYYQALPGIPTIPYLDNGLLKSLKLYNKDNELVKHSSYQYQLIDPKAFWAFRLDAGRFENGFGSCDGTFSWLRTYFYPIIQGKYVVDKITEVQKEGNNTLTTITDNDYLVSTFPLPTRVYENRSDGRRNRKDILYSFQYYDIYGDLTYDQKYACQKLVNQNCIIPIQETNYVDDEFVSLIRTNYKDWNPDPNNSCLAPESIITKNNGQLTFNTPVTINKFDISNGHPVSISYQDGRIIYYIWGYNGQYPIAMIENFTVAQAAEIETTLVYPAIMASNYDVDKTTEDELRTALDNIRKSEKLKNCLITTFTYDPLIGMTSKTDSNGVTSFFKYDSNGRLEFLLDKDGNVLKRYKYHYQD